MTETLLKKNTKGTYGTMYYAKDMKKTVALFRDSLGYAPTFESDEWTEFSIHGHSICLHKMGPENKAHNGILIIRVTDIRGIVADLKKRDVKVADIHEVHPGAYSVNFTDADGNIFSLYEGP